MSYIITLKLELDFPKLPEQSIVDAEYLGIFSEIRHYCTNYIISVML